MAARVKGLLAALDCNNREAAEMRRESGLQASLASECDTALAPLAARLNMCKESYGTPDAVGTTPSCPELAASLKPAAVAAAAAAPSAMRSRRSAACGAGSQLHAEQAGSCLLQLQGVPNLMAHKLGCCAPCFAEV